MKWQYNDYADEQLRQADQAEALRLVRIGDIRSVVEVGFRTTFAATALRVALGRDPEVYVGFDNDNNHVEAAMTILPEHTWVMASWPIDAYPKEAPRRPDLLLILNATHLLDQIGVYRRLPHLLRWLRTEGVMPKQILFEDTGADPGTWKTEYTEEAIAMFDEFYPDHRLTHSIETHKGATLRLELP